MGTNIKSNIIIAFQMRKVSNFKLFFRNKSGINIENKEYIDQER